MKSQLDLFGHEPEAKKSVKRSRNGSRKSDSGELLHRIEAIEGRFDRVEQVLTQLHALMAVKKVIKDRYTVKEVSAIVGRKDYTVREWCRKQRLLAEKAMCGRGSEKSWLVSHDELTRYQNEGLRPEPDHYRMVGTAGK